MRMVGVLAVLAAACGSSTHNGVSDGAVGESVAVDAPPQFVEPIHFYGRWTTMSAGWPGSAFAARFSGTQLQAKLADTGNEWIEVTVDDVVRAPIALTSGSQTVTLVSGLAPGEHDVVVSKRTESFFGTLRFEGFEGATIIPTPRATRLIEFIGDSITAGYGVLGALPCAFNQATEAESRAWGAIAAHDLGAAHTAIAYSGIGMVRNNGGSTTNTMPVRYGRAFADAAMPAWAWSYTPDVVVIGVGTNDFSGGDPGMAYVDAYAAFITDAVRAHAPGVPVLLATSSMVGGTARTQLRASLDAVVARLGDPTIRVVDIPEQLAADGYGCDSHPNETTARKMATALVPAIRAVTGW